MTELAGIPCAYCGGRHHRASEVRACWARSDGEVVDATPGATPGAGAEADPEPDHARRPAPRPAAAAPGKATQGRANQGRANQGKAIEGAAALGEAALRLGPILGRSVLVAPGAPAPAGWAGCARVGADTDGLEAAWRDRVPVVIELDPDAAPGAAAFEVERGPVWSLPAGFSFPGETRAHALLANAVDARGEVARWALAEAAVALGARPAGEGVPGGAVPGGAVPGGAVPADVVLPDGTPAVLDGGPLSWRGRLEGAAVVPALAVAAGSLAPFGTNTTEAELAPDQVAAVTHPGGAARIIAPAGSGKTRVLTERARHLLRRWNLPGRAVILVAFNKRAADEMRERTVDLPELQVRTLNALGLAIANRAGRVTTIDERQVRGILDDLVDLPRRANSDPAAAWLEAFSAVRLGLRDPAEVEAELGGDVDGLPEVLERYRDVLSERGLVDFDEQIYRALEVLLADPAARAAARASCRLLLVDEFQDLTPAHLLLVRLLAGPAGAVFGVGDDDQTIYGYSGATPAWLIDYARFFPTAGDHPLEVNYRCPPAVVEAASTLLTHNRRRVDKAIRPAPLREVAPGALAVRREGGLAATVEVVGDLVAGGAAPGEVAVLTRVNVSLAPVQVALAEAGVAVRPAVDTAFLSRTGVQAALAWLRLAGASPDRLPGADVALAARRPSRGVSPRLAGWMGEQRTLTGLRRLAGRLSERDGEKVLGFVADLELVRGRAGGGTRAVLRAVRDDLGLDRAMALLDGSRRRLDRSAQGDDLDALVALGALHEDPGGFEAWLRGRLSAPGSPDGVVLSTIHRVKGREWPHVVLHEVSAGLLPHRLAEDVEEERRVFHVGVTRASASLHVVAGDPPSPFLDELAEAWTPDRAPVRAERPRGGADPAARTAAGRAGRSARGSGAGLPAEEEVVAEVGLVVEAGGQRQEVVAVEDDGVLTKVGRARARVAFGSLVTVAGRRCRLVPVPPPEAAVDQAREQLKAWRSTQAAEQAKPAYVILHDKTIEALATGLPASMEALARVKGIGPAKLEAYGEDLLGICAAAREADGAA